ncbi:MAG: hypothetical protein KatS3mg028_1648 [Bacteroidia bacterium]|nr:MAG: hypothetical protein KatS3mg028_1648 [Bacteroidia bacterium]
MALNSRKDKILSILMLTLMIGLVLYQSKYFICGLAYHFESKNAKAKITKKYKKDSSRFIEYIYYNEFIKDSVRNIREVTNPKQWKKYSLHQEYKISYTICTSTYVVFKSIDNEPLFLTVIFLLIIEVYAIWLIIRVLLDKTSLSTLVGVRRKDKSQ